MDQQHYACQIDELHDGDLLELAQCLIVLGVMLLPSRDSLESITYHPIYGYNDYG